MKRRRKRQQLAALYGLDVRHGRLWFTDENGEQASLPFSAVDAGDVITAARMLEEPVKHVIYLRSTYERFLAVQDRRRDAAASTARVGRTVARLIDSATASVAPDLRDRLEEWAADVHYIEGRWSRLRWAIALRLWTVRSLRREARKAAERDVPRRA